MFSIFVSTFYHGDYRCITLRPLELQDEAEKHRTEAAVKASSQAGELDIGKLRLFFLRLTVLITVVCDFVGFEHGEKDKLSRYTIYMHIIMQLLYICIPSTKVFE